jgi:hypothetical protein
MEFFRMPKFSVTWNRFFVNVLTRGKFHGKVGEMGIFRGKSFCLKIPRKKLYEKSTPGTLKITLKT